MLTIVTVFGHSPEIAKMWVEEHLKVLPPAQLVILVENLYYPDFEVTAWLLKGCRERPNWLLLSTLRNVTPTTFFSHGKALDLALQYVKTKYVLTLDSDAFIRNFSVVERVLDIAERENAVVVGALQENISLPYIQPWFALYRTDFARKIGFQERHYRPSLPQEYMQFFKPHPSDIYSEVRKTYMDIGEKIYLDAVLQGEKVINFRPSPDEVTHLWKATPFVWMFNNGHEFYRTGRFQGRPFSLI